MYLYAYVVIVCYISLGIFTTLHQPDGHHPISASQSSTSHAIVAFKVMRTFLGNKVLFEVNPPSFLGDFLEVKQIPITASLARKKLLLEEILRSPVEVGSFIRLCIRFSYSPSGAEFLPSTVSENICLL